VATVSSCHSADRGLLYGDGVFRTFRHGLEGAWDREGQYALLSRDCAALSIPAPDAATLDAAIAAATATSSAVQQVVRVTVTRGRGPRGYRPPPEVSTAVHVAADGAPPLRGWDAGYRLRVCNLRLGGQPRLAGIKHLNRLENVLARSEWDDPTIDDGVLLGQSGEVVETVSANIFWRSVDTVFAPALNLSGVAGRQRARIIEGLRQIGAKLTIGHFSMDALSGAHEAWVCNSVMGLRAVTAIGPREMQPGETARYLAQTLFANWQPVDP
jgi:4-amino-4-deoxychorismate lyase